MNKQTNLKQQHGTSIDTAMDWLIRLQSPNIKTEDGEAFVNWLSQSEENQKAYLQAEALWDKGEILQNVSDRKAAPSLSFSQIILEWLDLRWVQASLAFSLMLMIGFSINIWQQPEITQKLFQTALGEQSEIQLQDGSQVILNSNTKLSIQFSKGSRIAHLIKGEAFFHVKTQKERPFDVITSGGTVRVLGTRFSVQNINHKDSLVTVLEGEVGVQKGGLKHKKFEADVVLIENQQISIEDAIDIAPKIVNAEAILSWREKRLVYINKTLGEVLDDLNRYLQAKIQLNDQSLEKLKVSVTIDISNPATVTHIIAESLDLDVEYDQTNSTYLLK